MSQMAPEVPLSRVFEMSKDDWPWIVIGLVGSGCMGMYPSGIDAFLGAGNVDVNG
jgi:hypothetical protein